MKYFAHPDEPSYIPDHKIEDSADLSQLTNDQLKKIVIRRAIKNGWL